MPARLLVDGSAAASAVLAVRATLGERILAGELPPGTPLREVAVASELGVSRNTLREALRALVGEGLVEHLPHRGAVVRRLGAADVRDCYRVRRVVEGAAAAGATTADEPARARVLGAAAGLAAVADARDWRSLVEADLAFHRALAGTLGSPRLDRLLDGIAGELRLVLALQSRLDREADDPTPLLAEHGAIADAFAAGDGPGAAALVAAHLDRHEARALELLGPA